MPEQYFCSLTSNSHEQVGYSQRSRSDRIMDAW